MVSVTKLSIVFSLVLMLLSCGNNRNAKENNDYFIISGFAQGTYYRITYHDAQRRNLQPEIDKLLKDFERSLSVYDSTSIISRVNRNEDVEVDDYFIEILTRAKQISDETGGAFDISGEPLYLAWGFSRKNQIPMNRHIVDSLKQYVGMDKIWLEGRRVVKSDPNVIINGNAIAKGYSTDVVAKFLQSKGCENFLVDIGGEMNIKGKSDKGRDWRIGIDTPADGNYEPGANLQLIISVTDKGLATSGNYRRFYLDDAGNKIGHTINPVTGYPTQHNLLSCTVIADDCLTADAFATAFMVMGLDSALQWVEKFPTLEACFIYDERGAFKTAYTKGLEERIIEIKKEQTE